MPEPGDPQFSIIIPVHNGAATIARAIDSCRRQSHLDFEVLVIENASTDRTPEIVRAAAQRDARVRVLTMPVPGRSAARNAGIERARGRWLIFLDADDELADERLTRTARVIARQPSAAAVQCATRYLRAGKVERRVPAYRGADFHQMLRIGNLVPINSMAIRRDAAASFPIGMEYCEDWVFWLESLRGVVIARYDGDDAIVHLHDRQTSTAESAMRGWELAVSIAGGPGGLPPKLRLKRRWRQFVDLVCYRDGSPIPEVDRVLRKSPVIRVLDGLLRLGVVRRPARRLVRARLGV